MSTIVQSYDASNNAVYPVTHLRAVRDSNGTTLESMMQDVREMSVGYYECSTPGSTAAKTIATDSSVSLSTKILCKVKFVEKNTANNTTMNINGTGTKALYYNGVRAAANNSWYPNEVVDLYYDGTNYQAKSCADTLEYDVSLHQTHEITEITTTTRTLVFNGNVVSSWESETSISDSSVEGYTRSETNTGQDVDSTTVDGPNATYDSSANQTNVVYVTTHTYTHVVNNYTFQEAVKAVPMSYRHGGLKLRFISNSDSSISGNKYVQYRLMKNTWSTTVSDWQGVDDEPVAGSENLIKSGGVADSINQLKNAGYLYAGIATPTTNPGTPDVPVFYIANGKGTYTNFGGIDVTEDEVVILYWDTAWHKVATGIASNDKLTELEPEVIKVKISTIGYNFLTEVIPAYNNVNFPIVLEEGTKIVNNGVKVLLSYDSTLSDYITLENGKNVVLEKQVGYIQTGVTGGIVNLFISKIAPITTDNLIDGVITEEKLSEDVKNRLQSFDEGISSLGENVSNLDNRVEAQLNVITKKMTKISSNNLLNPQSLKSGYISVSGSIFESSTMSYSDYISVESGNTVYTYTNFNNFRPFPARFITAYDKDKNVLPDKGLNNTTDATEYEVPDGVKYIIVSVPNTYFTNGYGAVSISNLYTFEPYVEHSFVANRAFIEDALNYIEFTSNSVSTKGELNEGDSLTLPRININKSVLMSFSCDIEFFGSIEFGKRNPEQTLGRWWRLTSSTIEFWNGGRYIDYTSDVFKAPFSAQNNLQIIVYKSVGCNADNPTLNTKASLTIMSNGNVWELKQAFDYPENNVEMFVKSVDSKLTGCSLSAQPMDIGKNIWLFGDSYMSWDAKRWVYYLASFGYADNCLINAYAGQTTIDQIPVLDTLLKIGKPKYIVWCLGMNDGADDSSPSSNWMDGVNHVLEACSKYGIVPILATIPTVPTINHEEKNLYVRNSGHRYIDFAKAVGAKANGDWYSGMLDDGVHPTETGARALFGQAMADFAELAMKVV